VNVTNTGTIAQSTTVLAFSIPPNAGVDGTPLQQLFGFKKLFLNPGESRTVFFGMSARDLTLVGSKGVREAIEGEWGIRIGVGAESISKKLVVSGLYR
jgi:hypothetical protein